MTLHELDSKLAEKWEHAIAQNTIYIGTKAYLEPMVAKRLEKIFFDKLVKINSRDIQDIDYEIATNEQEIRERIDKGKKLEEIRKEVLHGLFEENVGLPPKFKKIRKALENVEVK